MLKCTFILSVSSLILLSCDGGKSQNEHFDNIHDSIPAVSTPQLDISGEYDVMFINAITDLSYENGIRLITVKDLKEDDTLLFRYKAVDPCAECGVEIQIWKNDKYVEVVRDTGFGEETTAIPASLFLTNSKFGTAEYERLSLYLSVRQYHPVEVGNKRFLFYLDLTSSK